MARLLSGIPGLIVPKTIRVDRTSPASIREAAKDAALAYPILVRVAGSHFIWKMVRRMVGVLAEVGKGGMEVGEIAAWLSPRGSGGSQTPASLTAPASGLFLERVFYEGDPRQLPLQAAIAVRPARG